MNDTAEVYLWGTRIGVIHQDITKTYASLVSAAAPKGPHTAMDGNFPSAVFILIFPAAFQIYA